MIEFVVSWERVSNPSLPGRMLKRGDVLQLDPDSYPLHAALAERLRRKEGRGWTETRPGGEGSGARTPSPIAPEAAAEPDGLLPHQLAAIAAMQNNNKLR